MLKSLLPRIMGFLVIIITLSLGPTIYTANSLIVTLANGTANNLTNIIALSTVAGFGAFIIIFGLLVSGGMLTMAGNKSGSSASTGDFMKVIGSVIVVTVVLTIFPTIITYVNTLIQAAINAGDTLGRVGFGIIPVVIYVAIIAVGTWTQASTYRKMRRKKGSRAASVRVGY